MPNLITWDIDNNVLDLSGIDTALQDKLTVPVPSQQTFRIGFYRGGSGDTRRYLDLGADPSIEFIVKPSTGNNRFDVNPVLTSPVFTRTAVDDLGDYYYEGSIDFASTTFLKALGINMGGFTKETIEITCLPNTSKQLDGTYLDIYSTATAFTRFWFETTSTTVTPPSAGGGTLSKVNVANNATASDVATALAAKIDAAFGSIYTVVGSLIGIAFAEVGAKGPHNSQTSGFTIEVTELGSAYAGNVDVESVQYNAQLVYLNGTAPQISPIFTLEITNSLYRDGQIYPSGVSSNFREGSVTLSTTDSATVTFSTALSAATYDIISLEVIYTGAGTPGLKLSPQTIDDKATTGFTVYLNGDATTDYRLDYKVTL